MKESDFHPGFVDATNPGSFTSQLEWANGEVSYPLSFFMDRIESLQVGVGCPHELHRTILHYLPNERSIHRLHIVITQKWSKPAQHPNSHPSLL